MNETVRIGGAPLCVQVWELPPFAVAQWTGAGSDAARSTASEAAGELLARKVERFVLDFSRLDGVSDSVLPILARVLSEAHRTGRDVALVRCSDDLFRRLQRAGVSGAVGHFASLPAATQGMAGDPTSSLDLHLQSSPELLSRLRSVVRAVADRAGLTEATELDLRMAVNEAAANAILHGSPEGARNHVHVSFHVEPDLLIVDVADQGRGFEPAAPKPAAAPDFREHGYGLVMMRRLVDRLEFFRDDRGMLVRLTKYLRDAEPQREWAQ